LPSQPALDREAASAELARRYFTSRGPATVQDFAWWSGFSPTDAQAALEMVKPHLSRQQQGKHVYWFAPNAKPARATAPLANLLPAYDEYTVAYKDRSAVLSPTYAKRPDAGNGIFAPVMLLNGQIAGTWKRKVQRDLVVVELNPFRALKRAEKQALGECAERYRQFLGAADLAVRFSSTL
jgi:hypothetical protein